MKSISKTQTIMYGVAMILSLSLIVPTNLYAAVSSIIKLTATGVDNQDATKKLRLKVEQELGENVEEVIKILCSRNRDADRKQFPRKCRGSFRAIDDRAPFTLLEIRKNADSKLKAEKLARQEAQTFFDKNPIFRGKTCKRSRLTSKIRFQCRSKFEARREEGCEGIPRRITCTVR